MRTRTTMTMGLVLLALLCIPREPGVAQDTKGRWALGVHGGPNTWLDDYNKRVVGFGGDVMLRYGISRGFSAGLVTGYEELKSNQDPPLDGVAYLKLQAIVGSVVGWIHLAPDKTVNPHLYAGLGAMLYKRQTGGDIVETDGKFTTSVHVPMGVGVDIFASKDVSIAVDLGYRVVDDYTDGLKSGKIGGYMTAKAGVNFYLGASAAEKEELARLETQRIRDSTAAAALRVKERTEAEALRVKALADAEARRIRDSTEAEARRLAELNAARPADTVMVLKPGTTVVLKGVNFETNKATLTQDSEMILTTALRALEAHPAVSVLIVGHTDNVGRADYNKKLSLRRAEAVKSWLVRKGIAGKRLTVGGKGFDEPIDDNTTADGRANNRRIEFRVLK